MASEVLVDRGWASGAVFAHRSYLILSVSPSLALAASDSSRIEWSLRLVIAVGDVAGMGDVAPLYLLQVGIQRTDPYTVMVTLAAMSIVTFALQGLSPAYAWTWPTALGLSVVAAFIIEDVVTSPKLVHPVPQNGS